MILLIINELYTPYQKGGAEISTQLLAESLVGLGHDVHVYTSCNMESDETLNGVKVHRRMQYNEYWSYDKDSASSIKKVLWHLREVYNVRAGCCLQKLIKEIKPDIIHSNVFTGFSTIVWKIASENRIPIVHTLRDFYLMCIRSTLYNNDKRCNSQCMGCRLLSVTKKYMSQRVDAVVGISKFILEKHLEAGYFKNVQQSAVIPNPYLLADNSVLIERRKNVIGYLGRIHPSKGVEYLLQSFHKLGNENLKLFIAGEGDSAYVGYLKKKYASDKIVFLGKVRAIEFLKSIMLLVVPSLWDEPFGRVIVEAHACGCPVFVSNRGGMSELVNYNTGRVFDPGDSNALFNMLAEFAAGQQMFNMDSFDKIIYTPNRIALKYENLYQTLL